LFGSYPAGLLGGADVGGVVVADRGEHELDIRPAGPVQFLGSHLGGLGVVGDPGADLRGDVAGERVGVS
jgi:hypothetical protein